MKLKDVKTDKVNWQRQQKKGAVSTSVDDNPKPLKKKSPAEIKNNTSRNNFYRSARTPGLGN